MQQRLRELFGIIGVLIGQEDQDGVGVGEGAGDGVAEVDGGAVAVVDHSPCRQELVLDQQCQLKL
jgi:hypothetical protein